MQVRRASETDAAVVAALHAQSWRETYAGLMPDEFLNGRVDRDRAEVWRQRLGHDAASWVVLLAVDNGGPDAENFAGFVALTPDTDDRAVLLDNLHVAANQQSRGLGAELLRVARSTARDLWPARELCLWVLTENTRAARFYEREGGIPDGTRRDTFRGGFSLDETRYVWRQP
jgi:ribosomal protein S18 acetylase RimI-like enzyme